MIKKIKNIIPLLLTVLFTQLSAQVITVQGVLRDNNNAAVSDGIYEMSFEIYSAQTGGDPLWSSATENVDVTNGVYSLGLDLGIGPWSEVNELWLAVTVGGESMDERVRLHISPYEQLIVAGQSNWFPESGNVGIGIIPDDSDTKLTVVGDITATGAFHGDGSALTGIDPGIADGDDVNFNNITAAGNIGVGTTSPAYLLDVRGAAAATIVYDWDDPTLYYVDPSYISKMGHVETATIVADNTYFNSSIGKDDLSPGAEAFNNWEDLSSTFDDLTYEWYDGSSGYYYYYKAVSCSSEGALILVQTENDTALNPGACLVLSVWLSGDGYEYIIGEDTCDSKFIDFSVPCVTNKTMKVVFGKKGTFNSTPSAKVVKFNY